MNFINDYRNNTLYQIIINDNNIGEGWVTGIYDDIGEYTISGIAPKVIVLGDPSITVERIHFEIVNLKHLYGKIVKTKNNTLRSGRITLEDDNYLIIMDNRWESDDLEKLLKDEGGIVTLYACNLLKKKGSISYKEASSITKCLYFFLIFLNGRRISPVFTKGISDDKPIWEEFFSYKCSSYKYVESWSVSFDTSGLSDLWKNFISIWKNKDEQDCLITSIHWYIEANNGAGAIDGSIIMIQNALELLYNWIVVERKKMIKGDDAKNISA